MKPFTDKTQQVNILLSRGLQVPDREAAEKILMRYGYYEIVNGYKTLLLDSQSVTERYQDTATFEHLVALYDMDKDIRNGVLKATLEIELSLRTAIAYTLAEDFGSEQRDYLYYRNFRQGDSIWKSGSPTNERAILLSTLNTLIDKNIEPFNHYRTNHGHIPPWILLKETTFGNLKYLFKLLKGPQKNKVIAISLGLEIEQVTDEIKVFFKDALSVISSFRNRAAHSGRIFNFQSNLYKLSYNEYFHKHFNISQADYRAGIGQSDICTLLNILSLFENPMAKVNLDFYISYPIAQHYKKYPRDLSLLSKEMNYPEDTLFKNISKYLVE